MTTIASTTPSTGRPGAAAIDAAVRPLRLIGQAWARVAAAGQLGGHSEAAIGRLTGARI